MLQVLTRTGRLVAILERVYGPLPWISGMAERQHRLNLARLSIEHPWLTVGVWLAIALAGLLSLGSLRYALLPDVAFPVVVVDATAPLETSLQMEALVTDPIEESLQSVESITHVNSRIYPGRTAIAAEFAVGTDLASAESEIESALKPTFLPDETDVRVIPYNLNESVAVTYAVRGTNLSPDEIAATIEGPLVTPLEQLPGVLRVDVLGNSSATTARQLPNLVRFRNGNAVALRAIKRAEANTLDVVDAAEALVADVQTALPQIQIEQAASQAEFIREATRSTIEALVLAIVLAVLAILLFLQNWRATLIAALAIPLSLLGTFAVMAGLGLNLETMTLLALALAIGIVVDDAIVEVENISRYIEGGKSPRDAALAATSEIGVTVSAATLTIVAVFLPVGLMGGVLGQFFKPFGLAVSVAVMTSLLVARTLAPVLAVWWLQPSQRSHRLMKAWMKFTRRYRQLLRWSLNHRGWVVGLAVASLALGLALIPLVPKGFVPKLDRGEFDVTYSLVAATESDADGTQPLPPLSELPEDVVQYLTDNDLLELYEASRTDSLNGDPSRALLAAIPPEILLAQSQEVGKQLETAIAQVPEIDSVLTIVGDRGAINGGRLRVRLRGDRQEHTADIQDRVRDSLPTIDNTSVSIEDIQFVDTGGEKPLQIAFVSDDLQQNFDIAAQVKQRIADWPDIADVSISGEGSTERTILEIEHRDSLRAVVLRANLRQGAALGDTTQQVLTEAKTIVPEGITLDVEGDAAIASHVLTSFLPTLALSIVCMFLVLLLLFRRWSDPLVVLLSLPLAVVGAVLGLLVTRSDFGMVAAIGAIFLLGLLDKNAVLVVDYTNQLRQRGFSREAALLKAGPVRLRPILMTAISTMLGMLPVALGLGAGSELRSPMAVAIIGGLLTSTVLSLLVVPGLYAMLDDWFVGWQKRGRVW